MEESEGRMRQRWRPWTPGTSLLLLLVLAGVFVLAHQVAADPRLLPTALRQGLEGPAGVVRSIPLGLRVSLGTGLAVPLCLGLVWAFVRLRRAPVAAYLALRPVGIRVHLLSLASALVFAAAIDLLTLALGRPIVPPVQRELYRTAGIPELLWLALIVGAPVLEETVFRGFLWAGLEDGWLGQFGTILATSVLWAAFHVQYDLYGVLSILLLGLVLGYVRATTGSLLPCLLIHAFVNLAATVETAWVVQGT